MAMPRIRTETVRKLMRDHGCTLLTKEVEGSKAPIRYRCKCGNVRVTCWNNFNRGLRCKLCHLSKFTQNRKEANMRLALREKLFTFKEVAQILGVRHNNLWREAMVYHSIPHPQVTIPGRVRKYYTERDINFIRKLIVRVA